MITSKERATYHEHKHRIAENLDMIHKVEKNIRDEITYMPNIPQGIKTILNNAIKNLSHVEFELILVGSFYETMSEEEDEE